MIISRQNVLDLIGANRQKYQSCLITCFSFDFTFFEERVMPVLRTANIRNVNVFLDGKFLDNSLEHSTGNEFRSQKTYGLNSIYSIGVFHPKIMLLTGPKHGLLIIGSGNVTNSGLNTNDEIWGAFHIDTIESASAPLFSAVWNYLQPFLLRAKGFNAKKIQWIYQYSPWLERLPEYVIGDFINFTDEVGISFIANNNKRLIYDEIIRILPKKELRKITIISPFYDEKGEIIEQINKDLKPKEIICLVDPLFGILPIHISNSLQNIVKFWNWHDCSSDFNPLYNRLHAKLFHFDYVDEKEYLLIGSMNASIQAFGGPSTKPVNEEAGLLLSRNPGGNYLTDLGIKVPISGELDIRSHVQIEKNRIEYDTSQRLKVKILYCEVDNNQLKIFIDRNDIVRGMLCILNHQNEILESSQIEIKDAILEIAIKYTDEAHKVFLNNSQDQRISNFSLIHRVFLQAKSNPDPIRESLDNIFAKGYDGVPELFAYVDFNWADEDDEHEVKRGAGRTEKQETTLTKEYDKLSQEEFNKVNQIIIQRQEGLLSSTSIQIAEFLGVIGRNITIDKLEEVEEDFEQQLLDNEDSALSNENKEVTSFKIIRADGRTEQKAINRFFGKLNDSFQSKLNKFYETSSIQDLPQSKITIKELSNMLIGLYILDLYSKKTYQIKRTIFSIQFTKKYIEGLFSRQFKEEYTEELREIEKKFKLIRIDKIDRLNKFKIYYSIEEEHLNSLEQIIIRKENHFKLEVHKELYNEPIINNYFDSGELGDDNNTIKGFVLNTLGRFLFCCNSGVKMYEYDIVNQKVEFFIKEIFRKSIKIITELHWKESETNSFELVLLDLFSFIEMSVGYSELTNYTRDLLKTGSDCNNPRTNDLKSNIKYILEELLPRYTHWRSVYTDERKELVVSISELNKGNKIFKKGFGFCELLSSDPTNLSISKPGLLWNEKKKIYQLENLRIGEKVIKY